MPFSKSFLLEHTVVVASLFLMSIVANAQADPVTSGTETISSVKSENITQTEREKKRAEFMAKYDRNHNGIIDKEERAAIRVEMIRKKKESIFMWDLNHDGKLDKREIARMREEMSKSGNACVAPTHTGQMPIISPTSQSTGSSQLK